MVFKQKSYWNKINWEAFRTSLYISGIILLVSLIFGGLGTSYLKNNDFVQSNGLNFFVWLSGVITNMLFLNYIEINTISTLSVASIKILSLFIIVILIVYFFSKKYLKNMNRKDSFIYALITILYTSLFLTLFKYGTSFIIISDFSDDNAIYSINPLLVFGKTFFKMTVIFIGIKIYLYDKEKLNTGLVAFRTYFYYLLLFIFLISIIIEIYIFKVLASQGLSIQQVNFGLILGVFNIMVYVILLLFGGIGAFSTQIGGVSIPQVIKFSLIDIIKGDLGIGILIIFMIAFIGLITIIYLSIRKIQLENFIKDIAIFGLAIIIFNCLMLILTNININFLITVKIQFIIMPVILTTLAILSIVSIIKYIVLMIKDNL